MPLSLLTVLQFAVPLVVIAWIGLARPRSTVAWGIAVAGVALCLSAERLVGLWLLLPHWTPLVLLIALAVALTRQARAVDAPRLPSDTYGWIQLLICSALLVVSTGLLAAGVVGRQRPEATVIDLAFPLRNGTYYIANAGSTQMLNAHLMTLDTSRFADYRGQSHGVDIVKLNRTGGRANGVQPNELSSYVIFGDAVYSPCRGRVTLSFDGAPDMTPRQRDRTQMAGNFVLIDCVAAHVLLGHLQRGSVRVRQGQSLGTDDIIGLVGNSGNSDEPHLHIHAQQRPADLTAYTRAEPLPVQFAGAYLARNDQVLQTGDPRPAWTPATLLYAQLGSSIAALLLLVACVRSPRVGRILVTLLFGYAAIINLRLALVDPRAYLDYAALASVRPYHDFILGFFAQHTTAIVTAIAVGQAAIALAATRRDALGTAALVGAIVFLLAIVPLGAGSGFPATVIMAIAALQLLRAKDVPADSPPVATTSKQIY